MRNEPFFSRKKISALILACILFIAVIRIIFVNLTAERPIIEYYAQNEWVDLGGSFHRSFEENTEGYSVLVTEYEILEKEKYFERYHLTALDQSIVDPYRYIMEVTIKIRNQNNKNGKLQIANWALIGVNNDFVAYFDQQLLMSSDDRIEDIVSSISTASGKEIEVTLPYPMIYMDEEKDVKKNSPYKIAVTKYPARKYIQFG